MKTIKELEKEIEEITKKFETLEAYEIDKLAEEGDDIGERHTKADAQLQTLKDVVKFLEGEKRYGLLNNYIYQELKQKITGK